MKNNKILMLMFVVVLFFLLTGFTNLADNEIIEDDPIENNTNETTWLARQLEELGVPIAISTGIGSLATAGGISLITRGFRKKNKEISKELEKAKLTGKELKEAKDEIKLLNNSLKDYEKATKEKVDNLVKEQISPLLEEVRDLAVDLKEIKNNYKAGAEKLNRLVDGNLEEIKTKDSINEI